MNVVAQRDVEKCVNRLDSANARIRQGGTQIVNTVSRRCSNIENSTRPEHLQHGFNESSVEGIASASMVVRLLVPSACSCLIAALAIYRPVQNGGPAAAT